MRKAELRKSYLSKQKAILPKDRAANSKAISDLFLKTFELDAIKYLHSFLPIEKFNEVDTRLILENVWRKYPDIQTLVPRVDFEKDEIRNLNYGPDTELTRNAWDIEEPTHDEFVEADSIDLVLVPGLYFDAHGHRVGYGKGFYDRFLKTCRPDCLKIGLSYFKPVDRIDDVHEGDVRVDAVVTPFGMRNAE